MSASRGNYIGLKEEPEEQFGKAMRIPDSLLPQWYALVMEAESPEADPMQAKLELARFIVRRSHGEDAARAARSTSRVWSARGRRRTRCPRRCFRATERSTCRRSSSSIRRSLDERGARVIDQGGVKVNGETSATSTCRAEALEERSYQAGKRRSCAFRRLTPPSVLLPFVGCSPSGARKSL
jgi:tyrosyl-tRNA synthetase